MQIEKYGVVLERLTEGEIEMVREWRNSSEIARFMVYREHITPEMQERWFATRDPERDFHFIIRYGREACGLADVKAIDWEQKSFVAGLFLLQPYWDSDLGMRAAYAITDFAFFDLNLETGFCQVLRTNPRALRLNRSLGYRLIDEQEDSIVYQLRVEKKEYERTTQRLRSYLVRSLKQEI
jgi:UDP-4-amino-4,6-dideoxy-N-acetyl-beta-L-altrosamine N-acetyltransferase